MKTFLLLSFFGASSLLATDCINDWISLSLDPAVTECQTPVIPFLSYEVLIIAHLSDHDNPISSLEFSLENLPEDPDIGFCNLDWGGFQVQEDGNRYYFTFDPPLASGSHYLQLGRLTLMSFSAVWPEADHVVEVSGPTSTDVYGQEFYVTRGFFTFNPTGLDFCLLDGDYVGMDTHAWGIDPPQGSELAGEFDLQFSVSSMLCMPFQEAPFSGDILIDGTSLASFSGSGNESFSFLLSTGSLPPGADVPVTILLHGSEETRADIFYTVGNATSVPANGIARESFSTLKSAF